MAKKITIESPLGGDSGAKEVRLIEESFSARGLKLGPVTMVEPGNLRPNPENRKYFEPPTPDLYKTLKEDISHRGIMVPVIARPDGTIVAGETRWRIAGDLQIKIPTRYVQGLTDESSLDILITENIRRRQLSQAGRVKLIKAVFGKRLLEENRGGTQEDQISKTRYLEENTPITNPGVPPYPEIVAAYFGVSVATSRIDLAKARKEAKAEAGVEVERKQRSDLSPKSTIAKARRKALTIARKNPESIPEMIQELKTMIKALEKLATKQK